MKFKNLAKIFLLFMLFLIASLFLARPYLEKIYFKPQETIKGKIEQGRSEESLYEIIFENLEIPWSIVFLDNDKVLVTERVGKVKIFSLGSRKLIQEFQIKEVKHIGEGGLLGSVIHPNFSQNNFVYFYYTTEKAGSLINRFERYKLVFDREKYELIKDRVIIDNIPASRVHNGGRIKFGPDGYLYITTGDSGNSENAQNINLLAGKILRVKDDGGIPEDNPFNNLVFAYGIRNSQGIAWDGQGNLWSIDHGRSGVKSGLDEVNLIEKGKNYGWPIIEGNEGKEGMEKPVIQSGSQITWAPADLIYYNGNLFFTGLRGQGLYQYNIKDKTIKVHFFQKFGRLRALTLGPDGNFYLSTSNRDGRGYPKAGDDKIIKINPIKLLESEINQTIIIDLPKPNEVVKSPLIIKGKARGNWFFEATFPVILVDWDDKIISEGYVQAKGDWMTNDFVEFEGKLEFKNPAFPNTNINHFSHRGTLILKGGNPSGLLENQLSFEVPIIFK
jgi:glucose/arabinose dehydrogenase